MNDKTSAVECKALLEACTPHVYSQNAFRITGLLVNASPRDIKRRIDDLKAAHEIDDAEGEHTHAFALNPPPSMEQIQESAKKLHDPERRIIDEFFWFWPYRWDAGHDDPALSALLRGDTDVAFKVWKDGLQSPAATEHAVSKHNLAVMYHLVALDAEQSFITSEKPALPQNIERMANEYWHMCFRGWEELTDDEAFWSLITERIRMIDDPRLTTGYSRSIRKTFPEAFDRINAALAIKYAANHKYEMARKHLAYMNETHQGLDDVDATVSHILKPFEVRVNSAVEKALADSKKEPAQAAVCAKELIAATKEPLSIVKNLLDQSHSIRSGLFEQVTDACFTCLIAYGNETTDWPTCISLLKATEEIAVTSEAKEKIRQNIAVAQSNQDRKILMGKCWFCKKNKPSEAATLEVPMYGDVTRTPSITGTNIEWRKATISVPRCDTCKQAHSKIGGAWAGAAAGAAAGTAVMPVVGSIIGFFAGMAIGRQIDSKMRLPEGVAPESNKSEFPAVKEALSRGWAFGEKPSS